MSRSFINSEEYNNPISVAFYKLIKIESYSSSGETHIAHEKFIFIFRISMSKLIVSQVKLRLLILKFSS